MLYEYKCKTCEKTDDLEFDMQADKPLQVECPDCKGPMVRVWSFSTHIPDHMKATGDPDWTNKYHKFPAGLRSPYHKGGAVGEFNKKESKKAPKKE